MWWRAAATAVLREGRLVAQGSLSELRGARLPTLRVETSHSDAAAAAACLHRLPGIGVVRSEPSAAPGAAGANHVLRAELVGAAPEDIAAVVGAGVRLRAMTTERPSLEELFVSLTGEGFDVGE
jgi:ABC-2 type transport system ATP-binding protein